MLSFIKYLHELPNAKTLTLQGNVELIALRLSSAIWLYLTSTVGHLWFHSVKNRNELLSKMEVVEKNSRSPTTDESKRTDSKGA